MICEPSVEYKPISVSHNTQYAQLDADVVPFDSSDDVAGHFVLVFATFDMAALIEAWERHDDVDSVHFHATVAGIVDLLIEDRSPPDDKERAVWTAWAAHFEEQAARLRAAAEREEAL